MKSSLSLFSLVPPLTESLQRSLPGQQAHKEMTGNFSRAWEIPNNPKKSGVLMCLYEKNGETYTVFIKRIKDGRAHSGQIGLPGGRLEPQDPDMISTALREAEEEVNISPSEVTVIGQLTKLYIPVSNYLVYPTVGYLSREPLLIPEPSEVEYIIELPLTAFLKSETLSLAHIQVREGISIRTPAFKVDEHIIWGATAMILNEFVHVLRASVPMQ